MADHETHTLVLSSNSGRYSLDSVHGPDITSGQPLDILLHGQWVEGCVEYGDDLYTNVGIRMLGEKPPEPRVLEGYYFVTENGICGLCVGMKVRIPR